mmetsp:Transcript_67757/g.187185  ORF Transcript_67757/g.187185 Transcript_67757/m.187185 type:complete len:232 (+) Transcript_67757:409-1104(+)
MNWAKRGLHPGLQLDGAEPCTSRASQMIRLPARAVTRCAIRCRALPAGNAYLYSAPPGSAPRASCTKRLKWWWNPGTHWNPPSASSLSARLSTPCAWGPKRRLIMLFSAPCRSSKLPYGKAERRCSTLASPDAYCQGLISRWTLSLVAADLIGRYMAQRSWLVRRFNGSSFSTVAKAWAILGLTRFRASCGRQSAAESRPGMPKLLVFQFAHVLTSWRETETLPPSEVAST